MTVALLLGAGKRHADDLQADTVVTLDINPDHSPDFVHDMNVLPLPFHDNYFDQIHAYEVLEHTGAQGDYKFFFAQFSDLWRLLVPDGMFYGSVPAPNSAWVWADPGHTRHISPNTLIFLDQTQYALQVGKTAMSDYRHIYKADFEIVQIAFEDESMYFALRAKKPPRA